LHTRMLRVPFSVYLKPWQQRGILGEDTVHGLPSLFVVPLDEMGAGQGITVMRDPELTSALARRTSAWIPDQTGGTGKLLSRYQKSSLARFHDWFYSQEQEKPGDWPETYDQMPMDVLTACSRAVLEHPNDLLLRPSGMRLVTRSLLALGWHPRHIAGLICSKFQRDHGWGDQWSGYDPAMRAEFYTRLFAGLFVVGRDDLIDFNCRSTKEAGNCPVAGFPCNLEPLRQSAILRRSHEQLAHRPFNRLLL